jgi:hypothetical protein
MTLPAHGGSLVFQLVAAFAVGVKGLHQGRLPAGCFQFVAIRAALVFGGFIFHPLAVSIINMVADAAFFDLGAFIVRIMPEHRRRAPGISKDAVVDQLHVLLRVSIVTDRQGRQCDGKGKENLLFHPEAIPLGPDVKIKLALYAITNEIAT